MRWIISSVALSVVLTVLLNAGLRAFPAAARRFTRGLAKLTSSDLDDARGNERHVRVVLPWKAMILLSLVLTLVLNLLL